VEERQIQVLIEQANVQRGLNNHRGAIELLQRALSLDPDHARAHATLALALLGARRLPGAGIEARMALHLDGNDNFCHYAAAHVMLAERKLDEAWQHCQVAIQSDERDADDHVLGASIRSLRREYTEARQLLETALEMEPGHTGALTKLARMELEARNHEAAAGYAEQALRSSPSDSDAHIVAGLIDLARGDHASAEGHARFALNQDSTDRDAIHLWAAIKAHRSPILGLWWRFHMFVSMRTEAGELSLLIGSFVVVEILTILAGHFDYDRIKALLDWGWLGFCAYTWFAPELFKRMLASDLGTVALDPDF